MGPDCYRGDSHLNAGINQGAGRDPSGDYWGGRINIICVSRGSEWREKEKGFGMLVLGFRREDLIWKIRDLLLDILTIKH